MNERPDPLEIRLARFRPISPSPRLRQEITRRLAPRPRRRPLLAAALLLAASVFFVLLLPPTPHRPVSPPPPPVAEADPAPTLASYRRALAESPEALERRLDQQAARADGTLGPEPVTVSSRTLPD